jgi:hypothetical protein
MAAYERAFFDFNEIARAAALQQQMAVAMRNQSLAANDGIVIGASFTVMRQILSRRCAKRAVNRKCSFWRKKSVLLVVMALINSAARFFDGPPGTW